jgi:hypothetical protein
MKPDEVDYNIMHLHERLRREGLTPSQRLMKLQTLQEACEQLAFAANDLLIAAGVRALADHVMQLLNRRTRVL